MDKLVMKEMEHNLQKYYNDKEDRFVLPMVVVDVGSYDVNGSFKKLMPPAWKYLGVDRVPGPNVDVVTNDEFRIPSIDNSTDIILSSSCLQYVRNPFKLIGSAYKVLKPGGMVFLCAARNEREGLISLPKELCPNEDEGFDCWRFLKDGMQSLLEESGFYVIDVYYKGSNCWGIGIK